MGLAWCLLVLEKKCELTTPHNFGSRNPSVSTEIKISHSDIKKKHQNGYSLGSVCPREKVWINDPLHNFGSKNPSVSTESKFHLRPLRKSTKMGVAWCPLVLEKKWELTTPHNFGSRNPSVSKDIKISPLATKKKHQNRSSLVSVGPRKKVWINYPPQFWVKESICVDRNQIFNSIKDLEKAPKWV